MLALVALGIALSTGCAHPGGPEAAETDPYAPGLGEIMSVTQMRHLKLWYAGQAKNWRLASYEVDELEEGFADAARFHPQHKQSPRPLTELLPEFTAGSIASLRTAIAQEGDAAFVTAYDGLTHGCNGCHIATDFSFNAVTRPTGNPYTNQGFAAPK